MLSCKTVVLALAYLSWSAAALPIRREVPQEHSHNAIIATVRTSLNTNNPDEIQDPIFGLLGDAAAAAGQGKISNTDCLQQATADQAFTNAKAAGDVAGQVAALQYRALERNTGKVGLASVACTAITAVNPEIAAISQHQDPASANAASVNKAIVLELAKQIAAVGGNPQDALQTGTFKPGNLDDNTGKGNTCDVADDTVGCIISQNLLVDDATAAEISAAVAGSGSAATGAASDNEAAAATTAAAAAAATNEAAAASSASIGNFGSCPPPQIKFGLGFDNRKETSFEPADQQAYNHGSADNIDIITQFMCDNLVNSCKADATAQATCAKAKAAADTVTAKTGGQADAFNAVFGIKTDFAAVQEVDDQGRVVAGTGSGSGAADAATTPAAAAAADTVAAAATTAAVAAAATNEAVASSSSIGNFGSCPAPQIKFGLGFDNRKETSFEPADQQAYNHGSADNIDIITQFMCDNLVNSCKADATAQATCAKAKAAADTVTAKTGGQADAFNAVFGIKTDFAAVQEVDDQGRVVAGTGSGAAAAAAAPTNAAVAAAPTNNAAAAAGGASFGSCTAPEIKFGTGFDNRKETAFEPADQTSYPHGSADNIAVITGFICNELTNSCGANAAAKSLCAQATTAAQGATALTGAQADAFNAVFGIKTDFAAVKEVSNTGVVVN